MIVFPVAIFAINLFFPDNPGFLTGYINPYLVFVLIVAARYGKYPALISAGCYAILILLPFPFLWGLLYPGNLTSGYWLNIAKTGAVPYSVVLVTSFLIGVIFDTKHEKLLKAKSMLKNISRGKGLLQREIRALKTVNNELEKRVLTQKDSIIALYSRIQKLYNTNFKNSLDIIMESVQTFTGATSCSIWEYNHTAKKLVLLLETGWPKDEAHLTTINVDNSIEGWVVRNNIMFSAKMLMQYENLRQMDVGRSIFTVPILAGLKIWGVLNIEKLPFEKYNQYTEKILLIIMALVAPALERLIEFEHMQTQETVNPNTGLPVFSQFYSILEREIARLFKEKGSLSVVILELANYDYIQQDFTKEQLGQFMLLLSAAVTELAENKTIFFHYKADGQLCLIYPNLDFDGCSLFCLNLLEMVNNREWVLYDKIVHPEIILGYSSLGNKKVKADELINLAENLLDMQKI